MDKKTDWMVPGGSEVRGANGDFLNRKFKISKVQSFKRWLTEKDLSFAKI